MVLQNVPPQPSKATHWTLPQTRTSLSLSHQHMTDLRRPKVFARRGLRKRAKLQDSRQSLGMAASRRLSKASRTELQAVYLNMHTTFQQLN